MRDPSSTSRTERGATQPSSDHTTLPIALLLLLVLVRGAVVTAVLLVMRLVRSTVAAMRVAVAWSATIARGTTIARCTTIARSTVSTMPSIIPTTLLVTAIPTHRRRARRRPSMPMHSRRLPLRAPGCGVDEVEALGVGVPLLGPAGRELRLARRAGRRWGSTVGVPGSSAPVVIAACPAAAVLLGRVAGVAVAAVAACVLIAVGGC